MSGIRVNTGEKRIEVNDDGEYIVLNFNDTSFPSRYFSMVDRVEDRVGKAADEEKEIRGAYEPGSLDLVRALAAFEADLYRYMMAEVDGFFGAGTCKKVFGDIVPSAELFEDFFTQLMPYFETYGKERADKMRKYSANRIGNV